MTARASASFPRLGSVAWRALAVLSVLGVVGAGTGFWVLNQPPAAPDPGPADPAKPAAEPTAKPFEVGGRPLFADWPKEKPDLVIVVSGQTFGYLSPCGCSRPQYGGLERRYNLIQGLKAKGWEVIGVDVGDLAPPPAAKGVGEQGRKKYEFAMRALAEMGYVAVGVGKTDLQNDLLQLLGRYTLNNPGKRPVVLAANILGAQRNAAGQVVKATPREDHFKVPNARPLVEDVEVVADKKVTVGVIGMVGPSVAAEAAGIDPGYDFEKPAAALPAALKKLAADKTRPELKVLLYQGTEIEAMQVIKDHPEVQLVVRVGDPSESEPPMFAKKVGDSQLVMVGHKGRHVGLVGVFKTAKGLDLRYQLVSLGEEYLTPEKPEELAKTHKVLQQLEQYTREVKEADFLKAATAKRGQHPAQVLHEKADLKYIGTQACAKCHAAEVKKWGETKHSHAYEALEKYAKRPGLRQYDPDCVSCHTTGFEYATGFESETKTKELLHNGCENCHGPGSGHAAKPQDKDLLRTLTPWKLDPKDKLPLLAEIEKMAKTPVQERGRVRMEPNVQKMINDVQGMCMRCHDGDNDPHFDIWTYLPKIYHSGLGGKADLPPGIGR